MVSVFRTGLISVLGNTLAVIVFRRKGRDIAVSEVFLLNIAIVDLLLAGASYPATVISAFSHRWIFYEIGTEYYIIYIDFRWSIPSNIIFF